MMETERKTYNAVATREGRWWFLKVSGLDVATQSRRLDQADDMVRDLVATFLDVAPDSFDVRVLPMTPEEVFPLASRAELLKRKAREAQEEASKIQKIVARKLADMGISTRDIGRLLDISHQRVAQILADGPVEEAEVKRINEEAVERRNAFQTISARTPEARARKRA